VKILVVDPGADWSTRDVYNGLVNGLRAHGHDVIEYRYGRRLSVMGYALDRAWKDGGRERTKPTPGDAALFVSELAVTWALRHEPDWMVVVSGMFFHPDAFVLARRAGLRTALLLTESPYDFEQEYRVAGLVDMCWTNERTAVAPLRGANPRVRYLPHAFDPAQHTPAAAGRPAPAHDVVFVGTGFQERVELLSAVDWTGIDLGLYGMWRSLGPRSRLRAFVRGGAIENGDAVALYGHAKIGLNLFRQSKGFGAHASRIVGAESLNPRSYELAATGAFHLSDARPEVAEVFGATVPTFSTAEELSMLLRRYLADESARREHAEAARQAVQGHSWHARAAQVVADLRECDA
jgi:spore maturation protein CgeB